MTPLEAQLRERIRRYGPIPISEFMAVALGDPKHGYYRKADPIGARGDFITAPEISQVFGELIGLWCAIGWQQAGAPARINLVELGPGRGTLMADALRAAGTVPAFTDACTVHLVETSPALRSRQEATLAGRDIHWHETVQTVPSGPALIIANEFFDALPIDQYQRTDEGWYQRCVGIDPMKDRLCYVRTTTPYSDATPMPEDADRAPVGSLFEISPLALNLVETIGARIAADGIAALIIDYGHCHRGAGETLQAVRNHKTHDVLTDPGDVDLTAHVDFEALARRAETAGTRVFGPIPQGSFLSALGIEARTGRLASKTDPDTANLLRSGCQRLIGADGMGMLFKVLALTNHSLGVPAGFETLAS